MISLSLTLEREYDDYVTIYTTIKSMVPLAPKLKVVFTYYYLVRTKVPSFVAFKLTAEHIIVCNQASKSSACKSSACKSSAYLQTSFPT